jgi:hypothetical protein
MVAGEGGPQAGQAPISDFAREFELKKLLTGVIARGDVLGFSSGLLITATTSEVDKFVVAKKAKGNGDPTVPVYMPGEIAEVTVAAGGAATLNGALKIGGTNGQVTDQGAGVNLNKVVGWCLGKFDPLNKTLLNADGAAGDIVLMLIAPWRSATT